MSQYKEIFFSWNKEWLLDELNTKMNSLDAYALNHPENATQINALKVSLQLEIDNIVNSLHVSDEEKYMIEDYLLDTSKIEGTMQRMIDTIGQLEYMIQEK